MAYVTKYQYQYSDRLGRTVDVFLSRDGASAGSTTLTPSGPGHTQLAYELSEPDDLAPYLLSRLTLHANQFEGETLFEDFFDAAPKEWRAHVQIGGATYWMGYLSTDEVNTQDVRVAPVRVSFTDGIGLLRDEPFTDGSGDLPANRLRPRDLLIDLLGRLDYGIGYDMTLEWRTDQITELQNTLEQIWIPQKRYRDRSQETPVPVSCYEVLTDVLRRFGMRCMLSGGRWHIQHVPSLVDGQPEVYHYNSDGNLTSSGTEDLRHTVTESDAYGGRSLVRRSGWESYSAVSAVYAHLEIGSLTDNPTFNDHEVSGGVISSVTGWDLQGEATAVYVEKTDEGSDVAVNVGRITPDDLTASGIEAGLTNYVDNEPSGATLPTIESAMSGIGVKLVPTLGLYLEPTPEFEDADAADIPAVSVPVKLQLRGESATNYWFNESAGQWQQSVAFWRPRVLPGEWHELQAETPALPEDGTVYVQLGGPINTNRLTDDERVITHLAQSYLNDTVTEIAVEPLEYDLTTGQVEIRDGGGFTVTVTEPATKGDTTITILQQEITAGLGAAVVNKSAIVLPVAEAALYDNVRVRVRVGDGDLDPEATKLSLALTGEELRERSEWALAIGDGPTSAHPGTLTHGDGTITENWHRDGVSESLSLDELLLSETLRLQSRPRELHEVEYYLEDDPIEAHEVLWRDFGGSDEAYLPYRITLDLDRVRTGGTWHQLRYESISYSATVERTPSVGRLFGGISSGLATILQAIQERQGTLTADFADMLTSEAVEQGDITSLPVEASGEPIFKRGDTAVVQDRITGAVYQMTITADYQAGQTTLSVGSDADGTAFSLTADLPKKSYVYHSKGKLRSILGQTENAFRVILKGGAVCALDEAISSESRSQITVDGLVIGLDDNTRCLIKHASGDPDTEFYLTQDHDQGETTLNIDDGAGSPVTITAASGDEVWAEGMSTQAELAVLQDQIDAIVAEQQASELVAKVDGDVSGSVDFLPVQYLTVDLEQGDIIMVVDSAGEQVEFTMDDPESESAGATSLDVVTKSISNTISDGAGVFIPATYLLSENRQRSDEIIQRVTKATYRDGQAAQAAMKLASSVSGSVTSITVDSSHGAFEENDEMVLVHTETGDPYSFFLDEAVSSGETGIQVDNGSGSAVSLTGGAGDPIYLKQDYVRGILTSQGSSIQTNSSNISQNASDIDLRVTQSTFDDTLLGGVVGFLEDSESTSVTSIDIDPVFSGDTGTAFDLKDGEVLVVVDRGSRAVAYVRVDGDQGEGTTILSIKDPLDGGSVSWPTTMDAGSPIYRYHGTPDIQRTSLNLGLDGIEVEADIFRSHDWNGSYSQTTGEITAAGTTGWALTGVDGQSSDADITGTLHFGGGQHAGPDGIELEADTGEFSSASIDWKSGSTNYLSVGTEVGGGVPQLGYIAWQTDQDVLHLGGTDGFAYNGNEVLHTGNVGSENVPAYSSSTVVDFGGVEISPVGAGSTGGLLQITIQPSNGGTPITRYIQLYTGP